MQLIQEDKISCIDGEIASSRYWLEY